MAKNMSILSNTQLNSIVALVFCCITLSYIVLQPPGLLWKQNPDLIVDWSNSVASNPYLPSENLAQAPDSDLFSKYRALGETAEEQGNLNAAIRAYRWALTVRSDPILVARLQKLLQAQEQKYREETQWLELWQKAEQMEDAGQYTQALSYYETLASLKNLEVVERKISQMRTILALSQKHQKILKQAQDYIQDGHWGQALKAQSKLQKIHTDWPNEFKQPNELEDLFATVQQQLAIVKEAWPSIKPLLDQKRYAYLHKLLMNWELPIPKQGLIRLIQKHWQAEMVWISEGTFTMGSTLDPDEEPTQIRKLHGYYIDRTEVTNEQYRLFIKDTGHPIPVSWETGPIQEKWPVHGVSWEDAQAFAAWIGKRLPTEIEWEKAARGSDGRIYPWGNHFEPGFCNSIEAKINQCTPVAQYPLGNSPYGCCDMIGNVLEWTADVYAPYPGGREPRLVRPDYRVARGGSWYYSKDSLRVTNRYPLPQKIRLVAIGFRCALDPIQE